MQRKYLMKLFVCTFALGLCLTFCTRPARASNVSANDVTSSTLGQDENDSMPIGNGDLAANAWTEQNGDLVLLIAKSDSWSEMGKLLKLGRVRISLKPYDQPTPGSDNTHTQSPWGLSYTAFLMEVQSSASAGLNTDFPLQSPYYATTARAVLPASLSIKGGVQYADVNGRPRNEWNSTIASCRAL
jgi:hypothetical protein